MIAVIIALVLVVAAIAIYSFRHVLAFEQDRLSRTPSSSFQSSPLEMGQEQFVDLSFGRVRYVYLNSSSYSSSSPLNIFVHGFSVPMEIWRNVVLSLASEGHRCFTFDLYGRGFSDAPDVAHNADLYTSQLAELLFALNIDSETTKMNLFGVDMGGVIVQNFASIYPHKVNKLVLCCSAGLKVKPRPAVLLLPIIGPILFKYGMRRVEQASWTKPDSRLYRLHREMFLRACDEHPGYLRSLYSTVIHFNFQSIEQIVIDKLRHKPTLIIWGDNDTIISVENAYRYNKLYINSQLVILSGANHTFLIEDSEPALTAIRTFLSA